MISGQPSVRRVTVGGDVPSQIRTFAFGCVFSHPSGQGCRVRSISLPFAISSSRLLVARAQRVELRRVRVEGRLSETGEQYLANRARRLQFRTDGGHGNRRGRLERIAVDARA